jgi:hypothetical protein
VFRVFLSDLRLEKKNSVREGVKGTLRRGKIGNIWVKHAREAHV